MSNEPEDFGLIPVKHTNISLPPVDFKDDLVVTKKRKLQFSAEDDNADTDRRIPTKANTLTGSSQRVSSLNGLVKPALSPPAANKSYQSIDDLTPSAQQSPQKNTASSPLKLQSESTPKSKIQNLRRKETELDMKIRKTKGRIESLKRAKNILSKQDTMSNEDLILKWRDAAQKASNYLLNAAVEKVNKAGGKKEFKRREREKLKESLEYSIDNSFQDRIGEITNSEEYDNLPEDEKERILDDLDKEHERAMEEAGKSLMDDEIEDDEFTMNDLYKRLKMDYKLVYPPSSI
jgi:hypothetical protein